MTGGCTAEIVTASQGKAVRIARTTQLTAVLRLWVSQSSSATFTARAVPASWTESTLTWTNQPPLGAAVASVTGVTAGQYREFNVSSLIVGTGGKSLHGLSRNPDPQVEARQSSTYGILELTLHPASYSWRFVPEAGRSFTDTGTQSCH
jgi:hypothetical protein